MDRRCLKRWRQERIKAEKRDAVHDKVRDKLGIELGDEAKQLAQTAWLRRLGCCGRSTMGELRSSLDFLGPQLPVSHIGGAGVC